MSASAAEGREPQGLKAAHPTARLEAVPFQIKLKLDPNPDSP